MKITERGLFFARLTVSITLLCIYMACVNPFAYASECTETIKFGTKAECDIEMPTAMFISACTIDQTDFLCYHYTMIQSDLDYLLKNRCLSKYHLSHLHYTKVCPDSPFFVGATGVSKIWRINKHLDTQTATIVLVPPKLLNLEREGGRRAR